MPKVSIIMPSLNVHPYIEECLESVINQTLKDIEIICVDAGSTDGTLEVLQEYVQKDKRFKLIISDKRSYGYQMNLGIKAATGDYIGIVETDDYIDTHMYEKLHTYAAKNQAQIIKANYSSFVHKDNERNFKPEKLTQAEHINKIINPQKKPEAMAFTPFISNWSGIYNRQFIVENNIFLTKPLVLRIKIVVSFF